KTATHSLSVFHVAIVRSTIALWIELVVHDSAGAIADFDARPAQPNRVFGIFAEAQGPRTKPRIKQTDLLEDIPLEGNVSPSKAADRTNFAAIIDDGDVIFLETFLVR